MKKETGLALLAGGLILTGLGAEIHQNRDNPEPLNKSDYVHMAVCLTGAYVLSKRPEEMINQRYKTNNRNNPNSY
ncbi:hypothetical protein HN747_03835 [archaeon]|jgi:hypothetical protein|nr:hypothetical protein [archaeon]